MRAHPPLSSARTPAPHNPSSRRRAQAAHRGRRCRDRHASAPRRLAASAPRTRRTWGSARHSREAWAECTKCSAGLTTTGKASGRLGHVLDDQHVFRSDTRPSRDRYPSARRVALVSPRWSALVVREGWCIRVEPRAEAHPGASAASSLKSGPPGPPVAVRTLAGTPSASLPQGSTPSSAI